jgi:hypothetical protein
MTAEYLVRFPTTGFIEVMVVDKEGALSLEEIYNKAFKVATTGNDEWHTVVMTSVDNNLVAGEIATVKRAAGNFDFEDDPQFTISLLDKVVTL